MIIITGANGLLGQAVSDCLKKDDFDVYSLSRDTFDLTKENLLDIGLKPKAIIHLAAAVPTSLNYEDSVESSKITIQIDENVINAAKAWNCKLIYASTCAVYKNDLSEKIEGSELDISSSSHYVRAKIIGERKSLTLPDSIICRLPALIGEKLRSKSILYKFLNLSLRNKTIELWGDGSKEQNFLDVRDVAEAFSLILASNEENKIYNLANTSVISMKDLAKLIISKTNKGNITYKKIIDPNESMNVKYNTELIYKSLGWKPKISLAETISDMINAFEN